MKQLDAFLDVENVFTFWNFPRTMFTVEALSKKLPDALGREGYQLTSLSAFASLNRGCHKVSPSEVACFRNLFLRQGWRMFWGESIADSQLIRAVQQRLVEGSLKDVLLITCDGDFTPLVCQVRESGRDALVAGYQISGKLSFAATRCLSLKDILGDDVQAAKDYQDSPRVRAAFNTIPIPDTQTSS